MGAELHFYTKESIEAQKAYCEKYGVPNFSPKDGYCPHCHNPIYIIGGISVEEASKTHVTGCPYCHYSFVE